MTRNVRNEKGVGMTPPSRARGEDSNTEMVVASGGEPTDLDLQRQQKIHRHQLHDFPMKTPN
jgi:hypothetical protein